MGSCIRDVSFGTGAGGRWEEKYERGRVAVHVSLAFGGLYRSRCCFAFQYQSLCSLQRKIYECSPTFPLKDKSSSVPILSVSDCCALTYFLLSLILFPPAFLIIYLMNVTTRILEFNPCKRNFLDSSGDFCLL